MNILFLVKFYQPFDRGGSEWSTHDLARLLTDSGHKVSIITPNYGTKAYEKIEGIEIFRIPFLIKLKNPKSKIAPFWTNNIIWFIYSSVYCLYFFIKHNIQIIHVHSNEFIPAGVITSILSKIPTVATFRDYQALCSLGFCLWHKDKTCTIKEFIEYDFSFFWQNYVQNKNPTVYSILLMAAARSWIMQKIIYMFAKKVNFKIAVSQKVSQIFRVNGIKDMQVINNPILINTKVLSTSSNEILYVGKFSKGKGVDMLFNIVPDLIKLLSRAKFKFIGSGYLEKTFKTKNVKGKVTLTGQLTHDETLSKIRKASLLVVPSVWQEPLPRSAIETILSGTPVVATNVGGIPEVIKDKVYGVLCEPDKESLKKAIIYGFRNKDRFKKNIIRDIVKIKKHFSEEVLQNYLKVYSKAQSL